MCIKFAPYLHLKLIDILHTFYIHGSLKRNSDKLALWVVPKFHDFRFYLLFNLSFYFYPEKGINAKKSTLINLSVVRIINSLIKSFKNIYF